MNPEQFRDYVMVPVLRGAQLYSPEAERLLLMTAAQESQFQYLAQLGGGPARGLFQMEPATLADLFAHLPAARRNQLTRICGDHTSQSDALYSNLAFMVLAARLQYWRHPEPLPARTDSEGMWRYYKKYWNTEKGAATRADFFANWQYYGVR